MIMLHKTASIFKNLYWACAAAQSKKEKSRPVLQYLHVAPIGTRIQLTGCDGNRLHRFTCFPGDYLGDLRPGLVDIVKLTKSDVILAQHDGDEVYPDVDQVIPEKRADKPIIVTSPSCAQAVDRLYTMTAWDLAGGFFFPHATFTQFVSIDGVADLNIINGDSSVKAVLENDELLGLLMPCRMP